MLLMTVMSILVPKLMVAVVVAAWFPFKVSFLTIIRSLSW